MKADTGREGVADALEGMVRRVGHAICWINGLLVLVIVLQVFSRYVLGRGFIILEELEWQLYAAGFLFGLSYAVATDINVRMDLVYGRFSEQTREWIEAIGIIILLLPFIVIIFFHSLESAKHSWTFGERSQAPLGLPCTWIIRSMIPLSFALLAVAAVARLIRAFDLIRRKIGHGTN